MALRFFALFLAFSRFLRNQPMLILQLAQASTGELRSISLFDFSLFPFATWTTTHHFSVDNTASQDDHSDDVIDPPDTTQRRHNYPRFLLQTIMPLTLELITIMGMLVKRGRKREYEYCLFIPLFLHLTFILYYLFTY